MGRFEEFFCILDVFIAIIACFHLNPFVFMLKTQT